MRAIIAMLVVAVVACHAAWAEEPATNGPKIECDSLVHDFGTMTQYATAEHVFKFRNAGNETLKISKVHATCGCTAVMLSEKEIPPGKTAELNVVFKSQTYSGNVSKRVTVYSNDPVRKNLKFTIKAKVVANLVCNPRHLEFGRVIPGDPPKLAVKLFSPSGKKFQIDSVKSSLDFVKAEIVPGETDPAGERAVEVTIKGTPPPGGFEGSLIINAEVGKKTPVSVSVSGYIRARTEVIPPKLFFGVVRPGEHPQRQVVVTANAWEGLKIEKVEAPDGFTVTTEEVTEGKEWRVAVRLGGPFDVRMIKDKMKLYLNDTQMKEVEVKIYALISKKSE